MRPTPRSLEEISPEKGARTGGRFDRSIKNILLSKLIHLSPEQDFIHGRRSYGFLHDRIPKVIIHMNTDNIDHMIAVLTAYKEGKTIQYRHKGVGHWKNVPASPLWLFSESEYRVKPEPRVFWVNEYRERNITDSRMWASREAAEQAQEIAYKPIGCRKFVEVIEE